MKYLLTQLFTLFGSVTILFYFNTLDYFKPVKHDEIQWYSVIMVLLLIFLTIQAVIGLFIYVVQKLLAYGPKEFPSRVTSLKWGLGMASGVIVILLLNIFHLMNLMWGIAVLALIALGIIFI